MKTIGLIGCGNWGSNILRDLLRLQCSVSVVDTDSQARTRALQNGASKVCSVLEDLPVCDGYVVAVLIPDLTRVSSALLRFKKPIFSEKTLCLSINDFNHLSASGGGEYIFPMHKWHYHPGIEALRAIAASGRIGNIQELSTTRHGWVNDFHGGDVFWTQSVHDLTIIKHIVGYIPYKINAIHVIKDDAGLPVSFSASIGDMPIVNISVSGRHWNKVSAVSIQGTKGSAGLRDAYDDHVLVRDTRGEEKIPIDTTFPLYLELKEFVEYLAGGPKPRCTLQNAREVTEAIVHLRESAGL
jgi:predicted dehydrogenase